MKLFLPNACLAPSAAAPGLNGVCRFSLPGVGIAFAGGPRLRPVGGSVAAAPPDALKRSVLAEGLSRKRACWISEMRRAVKTSDLLPRAVKPRLLLPRAPLSSARSHGLHRDPMRCIALPSARFQRHPNSSGSGSGSGSSTSVSAASSIASWKASLNSDELRSSGPSSSIRSPASRMISESVSSGAKG